MFQFRPPRNDISLFLRVQEGKTRESPEYHSNRERLRQRLAESNANVIVALGNVSLYTLTGKTNVTKQRGSILESTLLPDKQVLPVVHPSADLLDRVSRDCHLSDFLRVRGEVGLPDRSVR